MPLARKSVKQSFVVTSSVSPTPLLNLMESFRPMCNDAIRIGLATDTSSLKRLSKLTYASLKEYDVPSCYKLCAISKAAGILAAREKSIRRGFPTKRPYLSRPMLLSCYGFKIQDNALHIPLGGRKFEGMLLNQHTRAVLARRGVVVRSFTLTKYSLSLCIAREIDDVPITGMIGIDRNLRNATAGNENRVTYYDISKVVRIAETTRSIIRSFKRNDVRIRKKLTGKYGRRRQERVRQILHSVSKRIVSEAKASRPGIAFEDIRGIRKLYRNGNGQGRSFRGRMNSWPFGELKRQVEYKAAWEGVPIIALSANDTKGTTMDCPKCGERLQSAARDDREHYRQLRCRKCERWEDRDVVAVMNVSRGGWVRFAHSSDKGEASEAMKGNEQTTVPILKVDASKPSLLSTADSAKT